MKNLSVYEEQSTETEYKKRANELQYHKKRKLFLKSLLFLGVFIVWWFIILHVIISSHNEWSSLRYDDFLLGKIYNASISIVFFSVFGMYWIPILINLSFTDLIEKMKMNQNKLDNIFQNKRDKYIVIILGGIIALSLIVQVIIHRETMWNIIEEDTLQGAFIHHLVYVLCYASVCAVSIILIYNKAEIKINRIMSIAVKIYFIMLPAVYLIPFLLEANISEYGGFAFFIAGTMIAPLVIIENLFIFFIIISVWYFFNSINQKKHIK